MEKQIASSSSTTSSRGSGSSREESARASHICLNLPETFLRAPNRFCFTAHTETGTPELGRLGNQNCKENLLLPCSITTNTNAQFRQAMPPENAAASEESR